MRLYLMRHAEPEEKDPSRYPDDRERPLCEEGRESLASVTKVLSDAGLVIDRILCSPHLRARQTAEITACGMGFKGQIELEDMLGGQLDMEALLARLASLPPDSSVLLVGHAPYLNELAMLLVMDLQGVIQFGKGAVMGLSFDAHPLVAEGELLFFNDTR